MTIALKMWIRLRSCDDGMAPTYGGPERQCRFVGKGLTAPDVACLIFGESGAVSLMA